jgi:hypothetical protein
LSAVTAVVQKVIRTKEWSNCKKSFHQVFTE